MLKVKNAHLVNGETDLSKVETQPKVSGFYTKEHIKTFLHFADYETLWGGSKDAHLITITYEDEKSYAFYFENIEDFVSLLSQIGE